MIALPFPFRQPTPNSCLPTAVRTVLLWRQATEYGSVRAGDFTQDQVSTWCRETPEGCDIDQAVEGLTEDAQFDVDDMTGDYEAVRATVLDEDDPQPVIVSVLDPIRFPELSHAIVLLGFQSGPNGETEQVVYYDPASGATDTMPADYFQSVWYYGYERAFTIRP